MEDEPENKRIEPKNDKDDEGNILDCPMNDLEPKVCDSILCEPDLCCKDPDEKSSTMAFPNKTDIGEDQQNSFEVVEKHVSYLDKGLTGSDDEDVRLDIEDTDDETDDEEETEDELMDTFLVDDSKENTKDIEEGDVTIADREPIEFGFISELLPVCVVTLDIVLDESGDPCYDLRELLKQRIWTQSPNNLDQLIVLYNLFNTSDTCLQLIHCDVAVELHIEVFAFQAIEEFANKVQSGSFDEILACMLLTNDMRKKMKQLNAKISINCRCESLHRWNAEYQLASEVLGLHLDSDDAYRASCTNKVPPNKLLVERSRSVDNIVSKCDSSSTGIKTKKEVRRRSL